MKTYYSLYILLCSILAAILGLTLFAVRAKGSDWCYRGAVTAPAKVVVHSGTVSTQYGHVVHPVYQEQYVKYVPYAVEVQVNKDRYYSLSDLYRDRIYLEAFDLMREMRDKLERLKDNEVTAAPSSVPSPKTQTPSVPSPQRDSKPMGKTSDIALQILQNSCVSCHNADTAATKDRPNPLRLDNPDAVSTEMRWAAFGRAAVKNMPLPPKSLRDENGAKLQEWREKNSLSDTNMKNLFDGWVTVSSSK